MLLDFGEVSQALGLKLCRAHGVVLHDLKPSLA
jgi:hypothetical protein